jgi:hypothetical protein
MESKNEPKAQPKIQPRPVQPGDLDKAIERIVEEYDGNIQEFFRDVRETILKQRDRASRSEFCLL